MVESISYDSFGNGSSTLTRYGYTGREWDSDSNLYYYRNRWYDPQSGRFISEDPIGLNGGINLFAYVRNNPFRFRDPMGLQAQGPFNPFRNPFSSDHWILNGLSNTAADILDFFGACHIANGVWVAADYRRSAGERIMGGIEAASTSALWLTGGAEIGSAGGAGVAAGGAELESAGIAAETTEAGEATIKVGDLDPLHSPETSGARPELERLSDSDLLDSVRNPRNGDPLKINPKTGKVIDGNGRAYELLRRAADPKSKITPETKIPYEPYTPNNSAFPPFP